MERAIAIGMLPVAPQAMIIKLEDTIIYDTKSQKIPF